MSRFSVRERRLTISVYPAASRGTGPQPGEVARRANRVELIRWPTGYGDCIRTRGPRKGHCWRTPGGGRQGAAGGRGAIGAAGASGGSVESPRRGGGRPSAGGGAWGRVGVADQRCTHDLSMAGGGLASNRRPTITSVPPQSETTPRREHTKQSKKQPPFKEATSACRGYYDARRWKSGPGSWQYAQVA